jgi:hypothetical protein
MLIRAIYLLMDTGSIADPGCFIPDPDPTIAPSRIRGVKKHRIPDPDPQHWIPVTFFKLLQALLSFSPVRSHPLTSCRLGK